MVAINKDIVLVVSLVLSVVSLVLLFGVTWYFQSSLDLLQQQVEYDRELLFKLQQEQISVHNKAIKGSDSLNTFKKHDVVKRQSEQNCQCKDGSPGPRGLPGNKGEIGMEGKQGRKGDTGPPGPGGDAGDRGPQGNKGEVGSRGPRGKRGNNGNKGNTGPRGENGGKGIKGDIGQNGNPGDKGLKGDTGLRGPYGANGTKGAKGDQGQAGIKGDPGPTGSKGDTGVTGHQGLKGDKGEKGSSGSPGSTGLTGPKGGQGLKGMKGEKTNSGTVYVRWGHDQCPSTAQRVYAGRAGGPRHDIGGGSNPQCLPLDPNYLRTISGPQERGLMFGAEYETNTNSHSHVHGVDDTDVPCAVCYVSSRTAVYMVPAKYSCPSGWTREYYGYLMSSRSNQQRTTFTCMDTAFKTVVGSSADRDSFLFYFVEGRCGSLPCPPYDSNRELSCAVCTK